MQSLKSENNTTTADSLLNSFLREGGYDFSSRNKSGFWFTEAGEKNWRKWTRYTTHPRHTLTTILYPHLNGERDFSVSLHPFSNVLIVDIDREGEAAVEVIDLLAEKLGTTFHLERSAVSGHYHAFWRFERHSISSEIKANLEHYLRFKYGVTVEVVKNFGPLPLSRAYITHAGIYDRESSTRVQRLSPLSFLRSFLSRPPLPFPSLLQSLDYSNSVTAAYSITPLLPSSKPTTPTLTLFSYGRGERWRGWLEIARYVVGNGGGEEQFLSLIHLHHDGTSRDMQKWGRVKTDEYARSLFRWAVEHWDEESLSFTATNSLALRFKAYEHFINRDTVEYTVTNDEYDKAQLLAAYAWHKSGGVVKGGAHCASFTSSFIMMYEMVMSKHIDETTRRSRSYLSPPPALEAVSGGTPIARSLLEAWGYRASITHRDRVIAALKDLGILEEIVDSESGYSYSYKGVRWCKHYTVNPIAVVYERYKEEIRSFVNRYERELQHHLPRTPLLAPEKAENNDDFDDDEPICTPSTVMVKEYVPHFSLLRDLGGMRLSERLRRVERRRRRARGSPP